MKILQNYCENTKKKLSKISKILYKLSKTVPISKFLKIVENDSKVMKKSSKMSNML